MVKNTKEMRKWVLGYQKNVLPYHKGEKVDRSDEPGMSDECYNGGEGHERCEDPLCGCDCHW